VLRAEVQRIDAQIARTEIRAPFSGTIGLRAVSPGSFLSSQSPVATLRQTDPIKLDFDVPERYAGRVSVGDVVTFRARARRASTAPPCTRWSRASRGDAYAARARPRPEPGRRAAARRLRAGGTDAAARSRTR
jgi:membrane fusion protein, multidrug efflux system